MFGIYSFPICYILSSLNFAFLKKTRRCVFYKKEKKRVRKDGGRGNSSEQMRNWLSVKPSAFTSNLVWCVHLHAHLVSIPHAFTLSKYLDTGYRNWVGIRLTTGSSFSFHLVLFQLRKHLSKMDKMNNVKESSGDLYLLA